MNENNNLTQGGPSESSQSFKTFKIGYISDERPSTLIFTSRVMTLLESKRK